MSERRIYLPASLSRFAALAAGLGFLGLGLVALPGAALAASPIKSLSKVAIEAGNLAIVGKTRGSNKTVKLDGGVAETTSDTDGNFSFDVAYLPEDCTVDLKVGTKSETAIVADCGPKGVNPRGAWKKKTSYATDDLVTRKGSSWRAKADNRKKRPDRKPAIWEQFAAKGNTGPRGRKGKTGPTGPQGETGATGPEGAKGDKGDKGDTGDTGDPGDPGPNQVADGTQAAPSISFLSNPGTGIFRPALNKIALTEAGQLFLHNKGTDNTALGNMALALNTGTRNTAIGSVTLNTNTIGYRNTAVGRGALFENTEGYRNTAIGDSALHSNTDGNVNTAVGDSALYSSVDGNFNIAMGGSALFSNTDGNYNTAMGSSALYSNSGGNYNTAIGFSASRNNIDGIRNIALGANAGYNPTAPVDSIFIGNNGLAADTTTIKIGKEGIQTTAFVAGIRGRTTGVADAVPVLIDSAGQLGTVSSSRRYKDDIKPMPDLRGDLMKLRPVTFRYKTPYNDGSRPVQYGLIAEEVSDVMPFLTVYNEDNQPETVKYHLLPSLLLKAYQGQQEAIEAQRVENEAQAIQIRRLEALVEHQAGQFAAIAEMFADHNMKRERQAAVSLD